MTIVQLAPIKFRARKKAQCSASPDDWTNPGTGPQATAKIDLLATEIGTLEGIVSCAPQLAAVPQA